MGSIMALCTDEEEQLKVLRKHMGVTQHAMAEYMGVPKRTYEDLEAGKSKVRRVHYHAAMYGCLLWAYSEKKNLSDLPVEIQQVLKTFMKVKAS